MLLWIVPLLLDGYLRFVTWTSKKRVFHEEYDGCRLRGETTIFVSFHQGLFYFIHHFRDRMGVVMASRSRDGELVNAILRRFGFRAVRGSSSRGGKEALQEMIAVRIIALLFEMQEAVGEPRQDFRPSVARGSSDTRS